MKIFYEDEHIIVCEKPAGVPSQDDKSGAYDMVNRLKNYIYEKEEMNKPPYISVVHRLDRPVGGIMVFARTKQAAAGLSRQIQNHGMKKKYLAVLSVDGAKEPAEMKEWMLEKKTTGHTTNFTDYLKKNPRTNLSEVVAAGEKDAKKAELTCKVLDVKDNRGLVEVELHTGRHHQIRVQMKHNVAPIVGDRKYNLLEMKRRGRSNIALYAYSLTFVHPITDKEMEFTEVPKTYPFTEFECII